MNSVEKMVNNYVTHYNHKKYWSWKEKLTNKKIPKFLRYIYLFQMRKMEAYNGASLGNQVNGGSCFKSPPFLPHGIKGIFITDTASIGMNCTILHQVTIGLKDWSGEGGPIIGDNVFIGAGAKIIGPVHIGDNVKIGANAVVVSDIPNNATVVCQKARIIEKV